MTTLKMPQMPKIIDQTCLRAFLNSFDNVLTDCDGVLWSGDNIIGRANDAVNKLRSLGKKIFYVTNNSTKSRDEYVKKCEKLGFIASKEEIVSSSFVMAQYLKQQGFNKKVYVVGTSGMTAELDNVGIAHTDIGPEPLTVSPFKLPETMELDPEVGAVAVGFDADFSFPKLMRAASHLEDQECLFIATNTDERFPITDSKLVFPGTGSFVRCVETVAERPPLIMGKPSEKMFTVISEKYQLKPSRTLMIGDRCNTDILFGKNCGLHTLVVLTGVTKKEDLELWSKSSDEEKHRLLADYCLPQLGDLVDLLKTLE